MFTISYGSDERQTFPKCISTDVDSDFVKIVKSILPTTENWLSYWGVGIVHCTCGHFLRNDTTENKKYIKSVLDLFSIPNFYIRKGRPHGHRYGKKDDQEYHTANQVQKKCTKRQFLSIHDRFIRDAWFRKTMIELGRTEEVIREMDKLANEDHTHTLPQKKKLMYTVAIGGYVRILLVLTRCP